MKREKRILFTACLAAFAMLSTNAQESAVRIPARIEAESFHRFFEVDNRVMNNQPVDLQETSDEGGGMNIGWTKAGEWLEYDVDIPSAQPYRIDVRVASIRKDNRLEISVDGEARALIKATGGGWQAWETQRIITELPAGKHTLRITFLDDDTNFNWFEIVSDSGDTPSPLPTNAAPTTPPPAQAKHHKLHQPPAALTPVPIPEGEFTGTYRNPIIGGFAPDPSICRAGEDYYLANSSFEFFPGIPIYHSRDLVNWKLIGYALSNKQDLELGEANSGGGVWAPTLRYHEGIFYAIVRNKSEQPYTLTTAKNPAGPWGPAIRLKIQSEAGVASGIDPDLFFDDDGKVYITETVEVKGETNFRCYELDLATGATSNMRSLWKGAGFGAEEGPHLYRKDGYYYLLLAEGGTWKQHKSTIARRPVSEGLDGPDGWEPNPTNPILYNDPSLNPEIDTTGHSDLIQDHRGKWWAVFLARRSTPLPNLARETYLAPVAWPEGGWPSINYGRPITLEMQANMLPSAPWPAEPIRDEFSPERLGLHFNFLRNTPSSDWSLTDKPGSLMLYGSPNLLAEKKPCSWIGRRLAHKNARVATSLNFVPNHKNEVAGLSVYLSHKDHIEFRIGKVGAGRQLELYRYAQENGSMLTTAALPDSGAVQLEVECSNESWTFRYSVDEGKSWQKLYTGSVSELIDGGRGFTGLYIAMYASGNGARSAAPAEFKWYEYQPL